MDWVFVGNQGNAPDTASNCYGAKCGSVAYPYWISKYDVTNAQYAEFLNAVDPNGTNTLGLYNSTMAADPLYGGITNTGSVGSVYQVKAGFANNPVNYVSFYDALRFANWLNNGQGSASTETGAYTLLGGTPTPSNGLTVTRNAGATIVIPSENEWYKAAYYNPATSSYFAYPAGSDTPTVCAAPGPTPNTANCGGAVWGGLLTPVGAYTGSASPYGTFDQGGNIWQWNEQIESSDRGVRGGCFSYGCTIYLNYLAASAGSFSYPTEEDISLGFRVATLVGIDVEPNRVALNRPPISVTIFGSSTVDVTKIDVSTLHFGPRNERPVSTQIVSENGQVDLVASFDVQDTGLTDSDTQACLQGTIDGQPFQDCTAVVIVNVACGLGSELPLLVLPLLWLRTTRRRKRE